MAKIRKRRIRWNASASPHVIGYKVYWSVGARVSYDSEYVGVGRRTEIVLPDDIPSIPLSGGAVDLGVTAVTEIGNESDMIRFPSPLEFGAPEPPLDLVLETVQDYYVHAEDSGQPYED
jgi:hypothetical protein